VEKDNIDKLVRSIYVIAKGAENEVRTMIQDILSEIRQDLSREGSNRLQYTSQAFQMVPKLTRPRILDVGCGQGRPTLELARLSDGEIIGLDIHQPSLDELSRTIEEAGLSDRVQVVNCSMLEMDFPDESFHIIWSEGSIHIIGFEKGLEEWRRLIRPNGFLVIHDMIWLCPDPPQEILDHWRKLYPGIRTASEHIEHIPMYGYELIGHFPLPEDLWWLDYYGPLEERIRGLREKYAEDREALRILDEEQREVDLFKKYSKWYGSAFFVMQKRNHGEVDYANID
jgi:ubiquinone/menaquinone biosynthesis C-methylase UbiE